MKVLSSRAEKKPTHVLANSQSKTGSSEPPRGARVRLREWSKQSCHLRRADAHTCVHDLKFDERLVVVRDVLLNSKRDFAFVRELADSVSRP